MDDKRFDLVTKSLSSGISRRSLLRSLGTAVGAVVVGVEAASAAPGGVNGTKKCYGAGSQCTNAKQCCSGMCINRVCAPEGECTPGASEACYSGPAGTAGVGICKAGTRTCGVTGQWGACTGEVLPTTEICGNGLDDDCDGLVDEGCGGTPCQVPTDCPGQDTECQQRTCEAGRCGTTNTQAGTPLAQQNVGDCKLDICDGSGNVTTVTYDLDVPDDGKQCTYNICNGGNPEFPPVEKGAWCGPGGAFHCDGAGECVPPSVCNPFEQQSCYSGDPTTIGVGVCKAGVHTCDAMGMGWGPCEGEVLPSPEICGSGFDEDCDGQIDNGCGCMVPEDCQAMDTFCQTRTCNGGVCGFDYAPYGTVLPADQQAETFCQTLVCDGSGGVTGILDDSDLPPVKPCVTYFCSNGQYDYSLDPAGTPCVDFFGLDGACDGFGACMAF